MFKRMLLRFRDVKVINHLILGADEQANIMGEEKPGAEHFVLSAFNLEDGTAKRVFEKFEVDSKKFRDAIKIQYQEALNTVGINQQAIEIDPDPISSKKIFKESKPSGQELMKSLHSLKKGDKDRPLIGAHVVTVAASMEYGIVTRALKVLGIDRELLVKAATEEIETTKC